MFPYLVFFMIYNILNTIPCILSVIQKVELLLEL